ncbi:MAG: AmmeMemoRadiSam system protein B [Anaerolineales bacterium]|nr:AmmeMemoRadiSam system protein B [Anaerolineales bacterium]
MESAIRPPAVAGMFYPGGRDALEKAVKRYLNDAQPPELENVRAVIAPHAGYIYSGHTAGYAYKSMLSSLPVGKTRVYLMGPSHRSWFQGVSTGNFDFQTPLGIVPTDHDAVHELVSQNTEFQPLPTVHQGEHCLEVQLPFLQVIIPDMSLVPLLFGQAEARSVGRELATRLRKEPNARVVVSSDLSHFSDYETACSMDRAFIQRVLAGNSPAVAKDEHGACGRVPILVMMEIAAELGWTAHLLDYRNSGDTAGDKSRVVGYAAVAYTDSAGAANE